MPRTLFDKIWADHVVADLGDGAVLLHIDRHFLHEVSGAVSLKELDRRGRTVRDPQLTYATLDHVLETTRGRGMTTRMPGGDDFLREFASRIAGRGIRFFGLDDPRQGIVHVVAAETGIALPGTTFICGDSHTCTVGGIGAFAWGVGSSDSEHALATQTIVTTKPSALRVTFDGELDRARDVRRGAADAVQHGGRVRRSYRHRRCGRCNLLVAARARGRAERGGVGPRGRLLAYAGERRECGV